jgi:hypothetical protein
MTEQQEAFLKDLIAISVKHGIVLAPNNCGCCGDTALEKLENGAVYSVSATGDAVELLGTDDDWSKAYNVNDKGHTLHPLKS